MARSRSQVIGRVAFAACFILLLAAILTPYVGAVLDVPRKIHKHELGRLRDRVANRDTAMQAYQFAHKELDIALAYLYDEHGVDRLKYDIDLKTGVFTPYAKGRAPNAPPTFLQKGQ